MVETREVPPPARTLSALAPEREEQVRRLHRMTTVIDAHGDSFRFVVWGERRLYERSDKGQVDFPRALEGGLGAQIHNILLPRPKGRLMVHTILKTYRYVVEDLREGAHLATLATSVEDIEAAQRDRKFAVILGLEGGEALEGDLELLPVFYRLGVRVMGLTWMWRNELADGTWEDSGAGLSAFGRVVVKEMNRRGIVIDTAHMTPRGILHTTELSQHPVICSHTLCRALANTGEYATRNIGDDQIRAIARGGGVVGLAPCRTLMNNPKAEIEDLMCHFVHVAELVGPEHVGLGSDYDGGTPTPTGLEDITGLPLLTSALLDQGFSESDVLHILGGNYLRVFRTVWGR
jgi:membrane dipeptidase